MLGWITVVGNVFRSCECQCVIAFFDRYECQNQTSGARKQGVENGKGRPGQG